MGDNMVLNVSHKRYCTGFTTYISVLECSQVYDTVVSENGDVNDAPSPKPSICDNLIQLKTHNYYFSILWVP